MKRLKTIKLFNNPGFAFCLSLVATTAFAAEYQTHESIHDAARQFMLEHTMAVYNQPAEITSGRLDSRLRLRKCDLPLETYLPDGSRNLGRLTVGVRCSDSKPWSLNVPIRVSIYKDVVVAAGPLARGTILSHDDIKLVPYDVSKLPGSYIEEETDTIGKQLKRRVSAGVPMTSSMMKRPQIIKRGQRVSIIAGVGGMEVRMSGKALAHGAVGDRIRVLNLSSKKKVEGTVTSSGDIRVDI